MRRGIIILHEDAVGIDAHGNIHPIAGAVGGVTHIPPIIAYANREELEDAEMLREAIERFRDHEQRHHHIRSRTLSVLGSHPQHLSEMGDQALIDVLTSTPQDHEASVDMDGFIAKAFDTVVADVEHIRVNALKAVAERDVQEARDWGRRNAILSIVNQQLDVECTFADDIAALFEESALRERAARVIAAGHAVSGSSAGNRTNNVSMIVDEVLIEERGGRPILSALPSREVKEWREAVIRGEISAMQVENLLSEAQLIVVAASNVRHAWPGYQPCAGFSSEYGLFVEFSEQRNELYIGETVREEVRHHLAKYMLEDFASDPQYRAVAYAALENEDARRAVMSLRQMHLLTYDRENWPSELIPAMLEYGERNIRQGMEPEKVFEDCLRIFGQAFLYACEFARLLAVLEEQSVGREQGGGEVSAVQTWRPEGKQTAAGVILAQQTTYSQPWAVAQRSVNP